MIMRVSQPPLDCYIITAREKRNNYLYSNPNYQKIFQTSAERRKLIYFAGGEEGALRNKAHAYKIRGAED